MEGVGEKVGSRREVQNANFLKKQEPKMLFPSIYCLLRLLSDRTSNENSRSG